MSVTLSRDKQSRLARFRALAAAVFAVATPAAGVAAAAGVITVVQRGRAFEVQVVHIHAGDTIRFDNQDEFNHQIYVASPDFSFDTDESEPGHVQEESFKTRGTFAVRCHIHPRMHLSVVVE